MHPLYTWGSNICLVSLTGLRSSLPAPGPKLHFQSTKVFNNYLLWPGRIPNYSLSDGGQKFPFNCVSHRTPHLKGAPEWLFLFQWFSNSHPLSKRSINVIQSYQGFSASPSPYGSLRHTTSSHKYFLFPLCLLKATNPSPNALLDWNISFFFQWWTHTYPLL